MRRKRLCLEIAALIAIPCLCILVAFGLSADPPVHLRFVVTANTLGWLQACGCVTEQVGGLTKKATLVLRLMQEADKQGVSCVLLDGGNLADDIERTEIILDSLKYLRCKAVAMGEAEWKLGEKFITACTERGISPVGMRLDVAGAGKENNLKGLKPFELIEISNLRIAISSLYEPASQVVEKQIVSDLTNWLETLRTERADIILVFNQLYLYGTSAQLLEVLKGGNPIKAPIFLLSQGSEKVEKVEKTEDSGKVWRITIPGREQVCAIDIEFCKGEEGGVRGVKASNHKVAPELPEEPEVLRLVANYYLRQQESLLMKTSKSAEEWTARRYASAQECRECHGKAYQAWEQSKHRNALKVLQQKQRLVEECLVCHSEFYRRYEGVDLKKEEAVNGVECASCHGDGVVHSTFGLSGKVERNKGRELCLSCHTPEHSQGFDYEEAIGRIKHW